MEVLIVPAVLLLTLVPFFLFYAWVLKIVRKSKQETVNRVLGCVKLAMVLVLSVTTVSLLGELPALSLLGKMIEPSIVAFISIG